MQKVDSSYIQISLAILLVFVSIFVPADPVTAQDQPEELPAELGDDRVESLPPEEYTRRLAREEDRMLQRTLRRAMDLQSPGIEHGLGLDYATEAGQDAGITALQRALLNSTRDESFERGLDLLRADDVLKHFDTLLIRAEASLRLPVVRALQRVPGGALADRVELTLATGAPEVVQSLHRLLPNLKEPLLPVFLIRFREGAPGEFEQLVAAFCLGKMGAADIAPELGRLVWEAEESSALIYADALAELRLPGSESLWLEAVDHPDLALRQIAISALTETGGRAAFLRLGNLALDAERNPWVQIQALYALANWPKVEVIPIYIAALRTNPQLNRKTTAILRDLTGRTDLQEYARDWEVWWEATRAAYGGNPLVLPDIRRSQVFEVEQRGSFLPPEGGDQ